MRPRPVVGKATVPDAVRRLQDKFDYPDDHESEPQLIPILPTLGGGSRGVPLWMEHLAQRIDDIPQPEDDEFDDDSFDGWTMVEPTGTLDIREHRGVCSVMMYDQVFQDCSAMLKAVPSVGADLIIELAYRTFGMSLDFLAVGPIMSVGTTTASKCIWVMSHWGSDKPIWDVRSGTFTGINVDHGAPGVFGPGYTVSSHVYIRMEFDNAGDQFRQSWSGDGIGWSDGAWVANPLGADPTHMGIGFSSLAGAEPQNTAIEYFRVAPGDFTPE